MQLTLSRVVVVLWFCGGGLCFAGRSALRFWVGGCMHLTLFAVVVFCGCC